MMHPLEGALDRRIAEIEGPVVELLRELVATPSVNPAYADGTGEVRAQQVLAEALRDWKVTSRLEEVDGSALDGYGEQDFTHVAGRPNLIAEVGPGGGTTVLLNSHIDVVGTVGQDWTSDPFEPQLRDGRVVGRGSADAKGSVVAMAAAMAVVGAVLPDLDGRVVMTSVVDEEAGGAGTLDWLRRGGHADVAIVGEPTDMRICPATRSSRRMTLTVSGRSAHPGEAFDGVNAIDKAMRLVTALREVAEVLDRTQPHPLWTHLPEQHVFNIQSIRGGEQGGAGRVPDSCVLEVAVGGTAAEDLEDLQQQVEAAVASCVESDPWLQEHPPSLVWGQMALHGSVTSPTHELVTACADAWASVRGCEAPVGALSGVTDMRHLVRHGGIPTLNFGPGRMAEAHGPDESVAVADVLDATRVLSRVVARLCG